MGSSSDPQELESLSRQDKEWIRRQTGMADMFADAEGKNREKGEEERFFASSVMFYDVTPLYFV